METFALGDSDRFRAWIKAHPAAYSINYRSPNVMMLHRAYCESFRGYAPDANLTATTKLCSTDRSELVLWAAKVGGPDKLKLCKNCGPR